LGHYASSKGPCTENANATLLPGECPSFPNVISSSHDDHEIFCQLQSKHDRKLCLDISGESATYGNSLIGWECSGHWNQLFRFAHDCTISAVQPDIIGRVRGYEDVNITMCLESTDDFAVATGHCMTSTLIANITSITKPENLENVTSYLQIKEKKQRFLYVIMQSGNDEIIAQSRNAISSDSSTLSPMASKRILNDHKIPSAMKAIIEHSYGSNPSGIEEMSSEKKVSDSLFELPLQSKNIQANMLAHFESVNKILPDSESDEL
jgi:hypothetical protein